MLRIKDGKRAQTAMGIVLKKEMKIIDGRRLLTSKAEKQAYKLSWVTQPFGLGPHNRISKVKRKNAPSENVKILTGGVT